MFDTISLAHDGRGSYRPSMATKAAAKAERPATCRGARALERFIKSNKLSLRGSAEELDISHVFLIDILKGKRRPRDVTIDKIAVWTGDAVTREMWRFKDETDAVAGVRRHTGTEG